jgi:hypothetical protein
MSVSCFHTGSKKADLIRGGIAPFEQGCRCCVILSTAIATGVSCRWRIYLTPGVKRPTLEPFNEWETAVIYLGQQVGDSRQTAALLLHSSLQDR